MSITEQRRHTATLPNTAATGMASSVLRHAMEWVIWGSNPGGGEILKYPFRAAPRHCCKMGSASFLGVKLPGLCVDHALSSADAATV